MLGHGSFGRVVFGLNRNTGEVMAVKQVYLGGFNSEIIQDVATSRWIVPKFDRELKRWKSRLIC